MFTVTTSPENDMHEFSLAVTYAPLDSGLTISIGSGINAGNLYFESAGPHAPITYTITV